MELGRRLKKWSCRLDLCEKMESLSLHTQGTIRIPLYNGVCWTRVHYFIYLFESQAPVNQGLNQKLHLSPAVTFSTTWEVSFLKLCM